MARRQRTSCSKARRRSHAASGSFSRAVHVLAAVLLAGSPNLLQGQTDPEILAAWCLGEPGSGDMHLSGVVTNQVTGAPLPGALVEAVADLADGSRGRVVATTHSELGGGYRICNLDSASNISLRVVFASNESSQVRISGPGPTILHLSVAVTNPVTIMGTVIDHATSQPLEGAWVTLASTGFGTSTNQDGRFSFVGVPPGSHVIEANRLGYGFRTDSLTFLGNALGLQITLASEAIPLDPIVVSTPSRRDSRNRASRFRGLDEAQMDSIRDRVLDFGDAVRRARLPQLRVREEFDPRSLMRIGICIESTRGTRETEGCNPVSVFIDGLAIADPTTFLDALPVTNISHFQFIPSIEAGVTYGQRGANGVLLIYTRRR